MNRTLVYLAALSVAACGGSGSSTGGVGAGGAGSESPPPASTVYQTAEGFCASLPKLAGGDLTGAWKVVAACGISTNNPENCADVKLSLSLAAQGTVTFNAELPTYIMSPDLGLQGGFGRRETRCGSTVSPSERRSSI